jgi:lipopolysaccharide assembly outer membrane protein LptD (OstA)
MQRLAYIWAILIIIVLPGSVFGEELDIEADKVEKSNNRIEASGNVIVRGQDGMTLTTNYMIYDTESNDLSASGNCFLKDAKGEIKAESVTYNTKRKDAYVTDGYVYGYEQPFKVWGDKITRYSNNVFLGDKIRYSPCTSERPAWSIKAGHLDVPFEGYGEARHAWFYIKDVPVFYFPYLYFPARLERHSGILFPQVGSMSDTGWYAALPIFFTLGRSADFTLAPTWLEKRGLLMAGELRYVRDYEKTGFLYLEGLRDKMGGDPTEGGVEPFKPYSRWYIRANNSGGDLTWDINLPSNSDYFRDIGPLYTTQSPQSYYWIGEQQSRMEKATSRMEWLKTFGKFTFDVSGQWDKDLNVSDNSYTIQQLPSARIKMAQLKIPKTPLYISADVNSINIYSEESAQGIKDLANAELSLPINLLPYFTLRPFYQQIYRDTHFRQKGPLYDNFDSDISENWSRKGITLTSSMYSPRFYKSWYHQIVPSVDWNVLWKFNGNYDVPPGDPDYPYPIILTGDEWERADDIKPALSNYIRDGNGNSIVELTVSGTYSLLLYDWGFYNGIVRISPWPWFYLEHRNIFGEDEHNAFITQQNKTTLSVKDNRTDELTLTSEYLRPIEGDSSNNLYGNAKINILNRLWFFFEGKYDIAGDRFEFFKQGIEYKSQCWGILGSVQIEPFYELTSTETVPTKTTFSLSVSLLGLGDISGKHSE